MPGGRDFQGEGSSPAFRLRCPGSASHRRHGPPYLNSRLPQRDVTVVALEDAAEVAWSGPRVELVAACATLKGGRGDWLFEKATEVRGLNDPCAYLIPQRDLFAAHSSWLDMLHAAPHGPRSWGRGPSAPWRRSAPGCRAVSGRAARHSTTTPGRTHRVPGARRGGAAWCTRPTSSR